MSHTASLEVPAATRDEPIAYPRDRVVGVTISADAADALARELIANGFLTSEIHIATGVTAADTLHHNTGHHGIANWLIRLADALGLPDEEMEVKSQYEQALRDGATLIAVEAPTPLRARLAGDLLLRHGAAAVHVFGRFSFTSLVRGRVLQR